MRALTRDPWLTVPYIGRRKVRSLSDRLAELSDDAAHEIRTALTESREGVLIAQKRIDSLRKSPLVVNGTRASLETLRGKLGEAEELYITLFRQVNANYGDETAEREPVGIVNVDVFDLTEKRNLVHVDAK